MKPKPLSKALAQRLSRHRDGVLVDGAFHAVSRLDAARILAALEYERQRASPPAPQPKPEPTAAERRAFTEAVVPKRRKHR